MEKTVYLKVDVDTYLGMKKGVPYLLDLFKELQIRATFFLSFGPDHSGKAIFNIWRKKGFLKKMLRTKAPALYGFKTMLYGTLLPGPLIALRFPDIVRRMDEEGHEIGVHAWNHRLWQDHLDRLTPQKIRTELGKACEAYKGILGRSPRSVAAPAWYCNDTSLSILDTLGLDYASDTRGKTPFLPVMGEKEFNTLQIPTTMTCLEEIIGREGGLRFADYLTGELREAEPNVFPVHAEVEGNHYLNLFRERLQETLEQGVKYLPLQDLSKRVRSLDVSRCRIVYRSLPGRGGVVACQEE
ncbi:MAG: 4-deoxy-4-formamido-L-arabinose-phosphoundecaprenol deformylase [Planctomycetes bacterium]|nr:4-deoxy-4-formamido-L-arabinose-phosphoundecaprenol deformylase [Planctomycetota bacterium]